MSAPPEQRVAIVTGGARGIGAAITTALARSGVHVAAGYSANSKAAEELAGKLGAEGASVSVHQGNVGAPADCERVINEVLEQKGKIDYLINNAGITVDKTVRRMTVDDWHAVLRINLSGAFYMTKAVLDHMLGNGFGRIVNISSVIGETGAVGQANYSASKAGLIGFSRSLAQEVARKGITVNCVAPGYIETEMVAAVPEEVLKKLLAGRAGRAARAGPRDRACGAVPRRRRRGLHHRLGHLRQRRAGHVVDAPTDARGDRTGGARDLGHERRGDHRRARAVHGNVTATPATGWRAWSSTATATDAKPGVTSPSSTAWPVRRTSASSRRSAEIDRGPGFVPGDERFRVREQRPDLRRGQRRQHRAPAGGELRGQPHAHVGDQRRTARGPLLDHVDRPRGRAAPRGARSARPGRRAGPAAPARPGPAGPAARSRCRARRPPRPGPPPLVDEVHDEAGRLPAWPAAGRSWIGANRGHARRRPRAPARPADPDGPRP